MPVVSTHAQSIAPSGGGSKTVGAVFVGLVALAVVAALLYAHDRMTGPPSSATDTLTLWTVAIVAWAVLLLIGVGAAVSQLAGIRRALENRRG
jgi:hypothetical protein